MEAPGWVCQTSGGLLSWRRVAKTTWALLPPPPATAALATLTPGLVFRKSSKRTFSAAVSEPEVHQDRTSRFLVAPPLLPGAPWQAASRSASPAATAAPRARFNNRPPASPPGPWELAERRSSRMRKDRLRLAFLDWLLRPQVVDSVGCHDGEADGRHEIGERRACGVDQLALHQRHDRAADDRHHKTRRAELRSRPQPTERDAVDGRKHQRQTERQCDHRDDASEVGVEHRVDAQQHGQAAQDGQKQGGTDTPHQPGHEESGEEEDDEADLQDVTAELQAAPG